MENVNCLRCRFRHEDNGNCTAVGGFCTAVPAAHCPLLREYLDTELTPEEILDMVQDDGPFDTVQMLQIAIALDRLEKYQEAEKDGRLAVLPCKVGDTLYEVTGRKTISEYRVKAIRVELFCVFIEWEIEKGFVWQSLAGITQNEIGKTVFLTREEAEKALEVEK